MDNLDDSENNVKICDSGYSNSSNSQSRSRSSKSTHSGSHSSGSSGYGGKPSTSTSNSSKHLNVTPETRCKEKDTKNKKQVLVSTLTTEVDKECSPPEQAPAIESVQENKIKDAHSQEGNEAVNIDPSNSGKSKDECKVYKPSTTPSEFKSQIVKNTNASNAEGFSCVISMADGVVMFTTASLTSSLGYPKEMWVGRSFIDFVHPRDRNTFASQITRGLTAPINANGMQEKVPTGVPPVSSVVCRLRWYRGLTDGFGVVQRLVTFMPFLLKLSFKDISGEKGQTMFLVIQATPFFSAFKKSNEKIRRAVPFVIRHAAVGNIEYVDPASVSYLGYMPQDIINTNALNLYHPDDLIYLSKIYETIIKEGGVPRCKSYRLLTQNGDYVKVETEWSSFINPWSKKLEFVNSTHHIVEGPTNTNVFQSADSSKGLKQTAEEKKKTQMLRDTIIGILTEVLTKPAEYAKQQVNKRCQDLATFMESLMDETPKNEEELRVEIHEPEYSYYERDSVLLGGISPHHENNDNKPSKETPLNYNLLNYNENLKRYFDSHLPYSAEDDRVMIDENHYGGKSEKTTSNFSSAIAQNPTQTTASSDTSGVTFSSVSASLPDGQPLRLTEAMINKHNSEMEKELAKHHREARPCSKGERVIESHENRRKKREHLARCNAAFQPTQAGNALFVARNKTQGVKRASKQIESESKHHCRTKRTQLATNTTGMPTYTAATPIATNRLPSAPFNGMNAYFLSVGSPQQMTIMYPTTQGVIPMTYYQPVIPTTTEVKTTEQTSSTPPFQQAAVPFMMCGQPWSPFMYPPVINAPIANPINPSNLIGQNVTMQSVQCTNDVYPLGLGNRNYEEACKPRILMKAKTHGVHLREKKRAEFQANFPKNVPESAESAASAEVSNLGSAANSSDSQNTNKKSALFPFGPNSSSNSFNFKAVDQKLNRPFSRDSKANTKLNTSEENVDRTDGESSYSSFYSSFLKTDSNSAEDSGDAKRAGLILLNKNGIADTVNLFCEPTPPLCIPKMMPKKKMLPPWLEQVSVTSELVYKYQIPLKSADVVLKEHEEKLSELTQPSLVNEQLGQLYLDLQLEGVAARLTLEEGISSSSSSGEECTAKREKSRKKREYSKLVIIHEEDAPMPPPSDGEPAPYSEDPNAMTVAE